MSSIAMLPDHLSSSISALSQTCRQKTSWTFYDIPNGAESMLHRVEQFHMTENGPVGLTSDDPTEILDSFCLRFFMGVA